jgi:MFS family permease
LPLIISPLAAELFYVVEILERNGDGTSYAQSYGLFTCAMAGGTMIGPILAGLLKEKFGWSAMTWALGGLAASGAVPVVCLIPLCQFKALIISQHYSMCILVGEVCGYVAIGKTRSVRRGITGKKSQNKTTRGLKI